jgi:Sec-independent protein translocase protein TatA
MTKPDHNEKKEPLARSLGKFFGHLKRGFTEDVSASKHEVSRKVEEEERESPDGKRVTLRRTTIEEMEVRDERSTG